MYDKELGRYRNFMMHRLILNPPRDKVIDHINRDKLDNRKENLRIASNLENSYNKEKQKGNSTSIYKGVCFDKGKFRATITYDNRNTINIGIYSDEVAAANAYNHYALKYHGEFACLNDVPFMTLDECEIYRYKHSSQYKGVHWTKAENKWRVSYRYPKDEGDKVIAFGFFDSEIAAANYFNHKMSGLIPESRLNRIQEEDYLTLEQCEKMKYKPLNTSMYKGVTYKKDYNKWQAYIDVNKKRISLGYYVNESDAAKAYNQKVLELKLNRKLNEI